MINDSWRRRKLTAIAVVFSTIVPSATNAQDPANKLQRPQAQAMRVQQVSPELEKVLVNWEKQSGKIEKLEGSHQRFVYDPTFLVEKRAKGYFYYEAPDKGRIDLEPVPINPNEVSRKKDPNTGEVYKITPDRPEKWVCDGKNITLVEIASKTYEKIPIPPEKQGHNIMEGPLPFLFGMPAEQAKMRYKLTLEANQPNRIQIKAEPLWPVDAQNYKEAQIILNPANYLPTAVKLTAPGGNQETVYVFSSLEVNKKTNPLKFWEEKDPFNPKLAGFKQLQQKVQNAAVPLMPSVIGQPGQQAQANMQKLGFKVTFLRGPAADRPDLVFVVKEQNPPPKSPVKPGQTVTLTLYDEMKTAAADGQ